MKRRRSAVTASFGTAWSSSAWTHTRRDLAASLERDRVRELRRRRRRNAPIPEYLVKYEDASRPGRRRKPPQRPDASRQTSNRSLRPLAWTALLPGVVVDAWIPYSDGTGYKRRPAVVVRVVGGCVQLYPITSKVRRFACAGQRGRVVSDVAAAGLPVASAIVWRIVEVERRDLLRQRGALRGADLEEFAGRTTPPIHMSTQMPTPMPAPTSAPKPVTKPVTKPVPRPLSWRPRAAA
jgi:hypothetical protein